MSESLPARQCILSHRSSGSKSLPSYVVPGYVAGVGVAVVDHTLPAESMNQDSFATLCRTYPDGGVVITSDDQSASELRKICPWPVLVSPSRPDPAQSREFVGTVNELLAEHNPALAKLAREHGDWPEDTGNIPSGLGMGDAQSYWAG